MINPKDPVSVKRIVITGDVLRPDINKPGTPAASANAKWLYQILAWPLQQVCSLPISCVTWNSGFDTEMFYKLQGLSPNTESWAKIHYLQTLGKEIDPLIEAAFGDALVIGCETPPCIATALIRLGIPLIDTIGHPIRFLDDLLNAWRSNHQGIAKELSKFRYELNFAKAHAGLIRAKMAWLPELQTPEETALVIGQVGSDKALIHQEEGRLLGFHDFLDPLFEISERHPKVLYKAHPYEDRYGHSANIIRRFKSFEKVNANFYWLISQENISDVYAISSGTVTEAKYFEKKGTYFYKSPYDFDNPAGDTISALSMPVPVEHAWLWPSFWHSILLPITQGLKPLSVVEPPYRANRIRRSINADWGFGAIDSVVNHHLR